MSVRIVPFTDSLWPSLQTFLHAQYPDGPLKADEAYFRWKFAGHPLGSSLPGYWLALDGDRVIGQFGVQTDQLVIAGQSHVAGSTVDLKIAADSGQASALWALFEAAMKQHPVLYTIGPNPQLTGVFKRLGWQEVAGTRTYYRLFRPGKALSVADPAKRNARLQPWLGLADRILPMVWHGASAVGGRRAGGCRVTQLETFGDEIDGLFARLQPVLGNTTGRSAAIWQWRYGRRPVGRCHALAARTADGTLQGCVVIKMMARPDQACWAEVADILVDPADQSVVQMLLWAACRFALQAGADFLRLRCGWPDLEQALQGPTWLKRPGAAIWAWAQDPELMQRLAAGPWTLTGAAGDGIESGRDEWPR